jgi:hypothetical protein
LQKRDLVGANDVNNERLRHQRLDEPAGLKERRARWVPTMEKAGETRMLWVFGFSVDRRLG